MSSAGTSVPSRSALHSTPACSSSQSTVFPTRPSGTVRVSPAPDVTCRMPRANRARSIGPVCSSIVSASPPAKDVRARASGLSKVPGDSAVLAMEPINSRCRCTRPRSAVGSNSRARA
jgi:hypothetical protein